MPNPSKGTMATSKPCIYCTAELCKFKINVSYFVNGNIVTTLANKIENPRLTSADRNFWKQKHKDGKH